MWHQRTYLCVVFALCGSAVSEKQSSLFFDEYSYEVERSNAGRVRMLKSDSNDGSDGFNDSNGYGSYGSSYSSYSPTTPTAVPTTTPTSSPTAAPTSDPTPAVTTSQVQTIRSKQTWTGMTAKTFPREAFKHAIATTTNVPVDNIKIVSVVDVPATARDRRFLQSSVTEVEFEVATQDSAGSLQKLSALSTSTAALQIFVEELKKEIMADPNVDPSIKNNVNSLLTVANVKAAKPQNVTPIKKAEEPKSKKKGLHPGIIAGIAVCGMIAIAVLVVVKKKLSQQGNTAPEPGGAQMEPVTGRQGGGQVSGYNDPEYNESPEFTV